VCGLDLSFFGSRNPLYGTGRNAWRRTNESEVKSTRKDLKAELENAQLNGSEGKRGARK
jgi:hypothetical protein